MSLNADYIKALLPKDVVKPFEDIDEQKVLGASNHISMIGKMIESIANNGRENNKSVNEIISDIKLLASYFMKTRGEASQAVRNAILIMIKNIETYKKDSLDTAVEKIINSKNDYIAYSDDATDKTIHYSIELIKNKRNILVYDYSSTVEKVLEGLGKNEQQYTIYIPESRIIDGGLPVVETCQDAGFKIKFFPDAALMYYLKDCDVALMGAETFYADGTGFNTTGSDLVGLVCSYYKIPLYFLTPLIKLDIRSIYGYQKKLKINDLTNKMTKYWPNKELTKDIDFNAPELLGVEPEHISGFVTEKGIIPSTQMFGVSKEFYKELGGTI